MFNKTVGTLWTTAVAYASIELEVEGVRHETHTGVSGQEWEDKCNSAKGARRNVYKTKRTLLYLKRKHKDTARILLLYHFCRWGSLKVSIVFWMRPPVGRPESRTHCIPAARTATRAAACPREMIGTAKLIQLEKQLTVGIVAKLINSITNTGPKK